MSHLWIGIGGLIKSRNGVMSLLVFFTTAVLCYLGKIDGVSFGVVCGVVYSIYAWTRARYAPNG